MDTAQIVDQIHNEQLAAEAAQLRRRQRLAAAVRRGLRAEAQLAALQAGELGPATARRLAAARGRDRAAVLAAVIAGVLP